MSKCELSFEEKLVIDTLPVNGRVPTVHVVRRSGIYHSKALEILLRLRKRGLVDGVNVSQTRTSRHFRWRRAKAPEPGVSPLTRLLVAFQAKDYLTCMGVITDAMRRDERS